MSKTYIKDVPLNGETIKEVFFHEVGGDKMFFIFKSGKVLVIPVYRLCPVQHGTLKDIQEDIVIFVNQIREKEKKEHEENESMIAKLLALKGGDEDG